MTELLDRVTNQRIRFEDLTGAVVPGRYLLLSDARVNNHPNVQSQRSFLCGDGSGVIRINDHSVDCQDQLQGKDEIRFLLASQSIHQIANLSVLPGKKLPSPLLPSKLLTEEGHLNDLEQLLQSVLDKGHLHEISRRPRMDMRYDEILQVVSRAKRFASSAHRHLASHSECWQRRTFTGIQPKRIMSLVSEDEYNLYENRVFARLLDRLERFLTKRLREIEELQQTISDAMDLEGSSELNYRLSRALFSIWGETFTESDTLQAAELLEETKKTLEQQLKTIKGLMHTGIYLKIPGNAQVPARLEPTNILTHDPHYRYLFPLWNTLTKVNREFDLTPAEYLEEQKLLQEHYIRYCGLVLQRALKSLGFGSDHNQENTETIIFTRDNRQLTLSETNSLWSIRDDRFDKAIVFCPIACWHSDTLKTVSHPNGFVIPCVFNNNQQPDHPAQWLEGSYDKALELSPLDFYVEERLISLLNAWLILSNINDYGEELVKLPNHVLSEAGNLSGVQINQTQHTIRITQPLSDESVLTLTDAFIKANARAAADRFTILTQSVKELSCCPVCSSQAYFTPRDNRTFKAECKNNSCKLSWMINHQNDERLLVLTTPDMENNSFKESGRWFQESGLA